jgi:hypothetical protein
MAASLSGSLDSVALEALVSLVHSLAKSGVLSFAWEDDNGVPHNGTITVYTGIPLQAETGILKGKMAIEAIATSNGRFVFASENVKITEGTKQGMDVQELMDLAQATLNEWNQLRVAIPSMKHSVHWTKFDVSSVTLSGQEFNIITLITKQGCSIQDLVDNVALPPVEVLRTVKSLMDKGLVTIDAAQVAGITDAQYKALLEFVSSFTGAQGGEIFSKRFHVGMSTRECAETIPEFQNQIKRLAGATMSAKLVERIQNVLRK